MVEVRYLISDAAKQVDVETHVLRYWEDELELQIPRNEMGHRYYTDYYIRLFRQIKDLKERGYQLKAIKNALNKMSGAMEGISITEEYMEEDMKAAWKESRRRERQMKERARTQKKAAEESKRALMEESLEDVGDWNMTKEEIAEQIVRLHDIREREVEDESEMETATKGQDDQVMDQAADDDIDETAEEPMQQLQAVQISTEKMAQFQELMNHVIGQAMEVNMDRISREITEEVSDNICEVVSETVSDQVTDRVMKEVEYLMRVSDEREEERFKQLDETIRAYQNKGKGRAEAAATKIPFFRKKRFGKSGRRLFG